MTLPERPLTKRTHLVFSVVEEMYARGWGTRIPIELARAMIMEKRAWEHGRDRGVIVETQWSHSHRKDKIHIQTDKGAGQTFGYCLLFRRSITTKVGELLKNCYPYSSIVRR